jgi:hypothetical protein
MQTHHDRHILQALSNTFVCIAEADVYHNMDRDAAATPGQVSYLNDLGVLPAEASRMTRAEASAAIEQREPQHKAFRDAHQGARWASGKQRQRMQELGMDESDLVTAEQAKDLIGQVLLETPDAIPPTKKQLDLIAKMAPYLPQPTSMTQASALINDLIRKKDKISDKQLELLQKMGCTKPVPELKKLTKMAARSLINQYNILKYRQKYEKKSPAPAPSPTPPPPPGDDSDNPPAADE